MKKHIEDSDTTNHKAKINRRRKDRIFKRKLSKKQKILIFSASGTVLTAVAVIVFLNFFCHAPESEEAPAPEEPEKPAVFYSKLTGEEIVRSGLQPNGMEYTALEAETVAEARNKAPIFCIQIPNGLDGARPQAGLNEAKIVFEAIAEAGITRFAAIYQDPTGAAIGPIRSLRSYYLAWDTPFDCTIIHAGGEDGALEEVSHGYRHLSESTTYMWRTDRRYIGGRANGYVAPNNLFSDATLLKKFNLDNKFTSSDPKVWPRLTPEDSDAQRTANQPTPKENQETKDNSDKEKSTPQYKQAHSITVHYGNVGAFNPVYKYNSKTNTYLRSYESGNPHLYYICENGTKPRPMQNCGEPVQVEVGVAIVMKVKEQLSPINHYREVIETTGSGEAWIFQNGLVIPATWSRSDKSEQISFKDSSGKEISLAPGKTWVSAVPASYGFVKYE